MDLLTLAEDLDCQVHFDIELLTQRLLLDTEIVEVNQATYALLPCARKLGIVPGATHLFEEAGTLEQVASQAATWFSHHLMV